MQKLRHSLCEKLAVVSPELLKLGNRLDYLPSKVKNLLDDALKKKENTYQTPWFFHQKPLKHHFPDKVFPAVYGNDYLMKVAMTELSFNSHAGHPHNGGNMRCFEATGFGSCLLTDRANQLSSLFEPDVEIIGYENIHEAIEKANFLINNISFRKAVAERGRIRTLRDHTTAKRCQAIHQVILEKI